MNNPTANFRLVARQCARVLAIGFLLSLGAAVHAWEPTKSITFIVTGGSGGGADQMARLIQSAATKHQLTKQPIIVVIENGGGGGQGFLTLKNSTGDPHKIMIALANLHSVPLATNLPFNWRDVTPVGLIGLDQFVLWVNAKSPYKTAQDYIKAMKAAEPNTFKMGGAGAKREDEIVTKMIEQATGVNFKFIPYKGGGEITAQLVGGHIDSDVNNPIEHLATWRSGDVRPLCVLDTQRMDDKEPVAGDKSWSDVPTCKEQGIDAEYLMLRGIFMPKAVSSEQVDYYVELLKKVRATPEWQDFFKRGAYKDDFLVRDDFAKFLEKDEVRHRDIMKRAGFLAKN
ncbi:MAG: tripartite tricarboxylate transporter substrate-binding protein [Burkholderiaceae bacterium]